MFDTAPGRVADSEKPEPPPPVAEWVGAFGIVEVAEWEWVGAFGITVVVADAGPAQSTHETWYEL